MARLNEPLVPSDTLDTLRRKFLRQNRDIARINSTQSLRIRSLENECARMLSENLDLRGQILRLETELQDNRAQRVADHALAIKEKMEAQLLDREEILAICSEATEDIESPDLGPPPVSRFVDEDPVKIDLPVRATTDNSEPPTLAESATDPVTRPITSANNIKKFEDVVAKEPRIVKSEQPARKELKANMEEAEQVTTKPAPAAVKPEAPIQAVKPSLKRKSREEEEIAEARIAKTLVPISVAPVTTQPEKPTVFKDRTANRPIKELPSLKKDGRGKPKNAAATAAGQRKPLGTKTTNENLNSPRKAATTKPNSNVTDEVAKAKSDAKRDEHHAKGGRAELRKEKATKEAPAVIEIPTSPILEPAAPITTTAIDIDIDEPAAEPDPEPEPEPEPEVEAAPAQEPKSKSTAPAPAPTPAPAPESPTPTPLREEVRDTPPPLDISSRGETTRGSRRTRMAVSYAEPNLRDKMRRPTKQLFDAVAGEGKNQMRRASSSRRDDLPTPASAFSASSTNPRTGGPPDVAGSGSGSGSGRRTALPDMPASPLAQKTSGAGSRGGSVSRLPVVAAAAATADDHEDEDDLPTNVVTDRRKRNSSAVVAAESENGTAPPPPSKPTNRRLEQIAAREAEVAKMFDGPDDDYELSGGSSASPPRGNAKAKTASSTARNGRTRRFSSVAQEGHDATGTAAVTTTTTTTTRNGTRKRVSMMATVGKSSNSNNRMGADDTGHDNSSLDGDSSLTSTNPADFPADASSVSASMREGAATRRRSMMI
ncbi:hypothetical protein SLS62_004396 [Diatrype stigma]|uniref:Shugoshin n=1 Tax=Diatrype stigma TaxID=117547 RepID=A0AAN9UT47_9PEZI